MNNMQAGPGLQPERQNKRYSVQSAREIIRWIFHFAPDCRARMTLILVICMVISLCNLAIPMLVGKAVDLLLSPGRLVSILGTLTVLYLATAVCGNRQGVLIYYVNGYRGSGDGCLTVIPPQPERYRRLDRWDNEELFGTGEGQCDIFTDAEHGITVKVLESGAEGDRIQIVRK